MKASRKPSARGVDTKTIVFLAAPDTQILDVAGPFQVFVGRDRALEVADGMEYQGKGWQNPNSNEVYAKMHAFTEEHPLCPVCLMEGDRSIKTSYKGKTYYFCAQSEKEFFEKHAEVFDRFTSEDAALGGQFEPLTNLLHDARNLWTDRSFPHSGRRNSERGVGYSTST